MTELLNSPLTNIVIIVLLALLNGVFALSELAVVSSKRARLQQRAREGSRSAETVLRVTEEPTDFLATVQIGITLIGIGAGAFGGATLADDVAGLIARAGPLAPYSGALGYVTVVGIITYLSLTVGELVPKAIALNNPERWAMLVTPPMRQLARVTLPLVRLLSASTNGALRLLGIEASDEPEVTEEEIKLILEEGAESGALEPEERQLVKHALDLDDITLRSLLTHRLNVDWLDLSDSHEKIVHQITRAGHNYLPLCDGSLDRVRAVARARDLLGYVTDGGRLDRAEELLSVAVQPIFLPTTANPMQALAHFRETGVHIIFAVDEHGGVQGIVTPFDVLERMVGKIDGLGKPSRRDKV